MEGAHQREFRDGAIMHMLVRHLILNLSHVTWNQKDTHPPSAHNGFSGIEKSTVPDNTRMSNLRKRNNREVQITATAEMFSFSAIAAPTRPPCGDWRYTDHPQRQQRQRERQGSRH